MNISIHSNVFLQIRGNTAWRLLDKTILHHKTIDIVNCVDNHPHTGPMLFSNAETVFFRLCDGNQLFYWLNKSKFPKLKNVYINSHFEPQVYQRFDNNVNLFITERTLHCKPWYKPDEYNKVLIGNKIVTVVKNDHIEKILEFAIITQHKHNEMHVIKMLPSILSIRE